MKKAFVLAMAVLATSVVAASAQGSQTAAARSLASFNCSKTITLPFVTPLTGGAGFPGTEKTSWATHVRRRLPRHREDERAEVRSEDAGAAARPEGEARRRRYAVRARPGSRSD